ncbi:MAG: hypothetical protein KDA66_14045, partial [Planctomycetaceae bacterium]|nr:hypothetical protein [Planctomycetaceae bacterium]
MTSICQQANKLIMPYYKVIDGLNYDRGILELAEALQGQSVGDLDLTDAEKLLDRVLDGGATTEVEQRSVQYILDHYQWTKSAREWLTKNTPTQSQAAIPA